VTLECWTKALADGYGICVLYLNYRKAFDSVSHLRLSETVKTFGIYGNLLLGYKTSFLSRNMRVGVRENSSLWIDVLTGVPQGSCASVHYFSSSLSMNYYSG